MHGQRKWLVIPMCRISVLIAFTILLVFAVADRASASTWFWWRRLSCGGFHGGGAFRGMPSAVGSQVGGAQIGGGCGVVGGLERSWIGVWGRCGGRRPRRRAYY